MVSDAFTQRWLRTDTYIDNLSPGQRRQMRALCEKFFDAGVAHTRRSAPVPKKSINMPTLGTRPRALTAEQAREIKRRTPLHRQSGHRMQVFCSGGKLVVPATEEEIAMLDEYEKQTPQPQGVTP